MSKYISGEMINYNTYYCLTSQHDTLLPVSVGRCVQNLEQQIKHLSNKQNVSLSGTRVGDETF